MYKHSWFIIWFRGGMGALWNHCAIRKHGQFNQNLLTWWIWWL